MAGRDAATGRAMRAAALAAALLAVAALAGAQTIELGPELLPAPPTIGARGDDLLTALVPKSNGWLAFVQRGSSFHLLRIDASGHPASDTRQVGGADAFSFDAAPTGQGLMGVWRRGTTLFIAPLAEDGSLLRPERLLAEDVFYQGIRLACSASRCIVAYDGAFFSKVSARVVDTNGNDVAQVESLAGSYVVAAAADPDGFLLIVRNGDYRAVRISLDGRVLSDASLSAEFFLIGAADFDGEQYVVVTASPTGPLRATPVSLDGEVGASRVLDPRSARYQNVGIAWNGTEHLVTVVENITEVPTPTEAPLRFRLLVLRAARDLTPSGAVTIGDGVSDQAFVAANGGSFLVAWRENGANRSTRFGPNGQPQPYETLGLGPLAQLPLALTGAASGPVAMWMEYDTLKATEAIRVGWAGESDAPTLDAWFSVISGSAAAIGDDVLAAWYGLEHRSDPCCAVGASLIRDRRAVRLLHPPLQIEPHVAASRGRWMIAGYSAKGVGAVLVDRSGAVLTQEPITVVETKEARRYDIASDGDAFLVVTSILGFGGTTTATLLDSDDRIVRSTPLPSIGTQPSVAWNGSEYAVALPGDGRVTVLRLSRDGTLLGTPKLVPIGRSRNLQEAILKPFADGWLMAWRGDFDGQLLRLSPDFEIVAALPLDDFPLARLAADDLGRAYVLRSHGSRVAIQEVLAGAPARRRAR